MTYTTSQLLSRTVKEGAAGWYLITPKRGEGRFNPEFLPSLPKFLTHDSFLPFGALNLAAARLNPADIHEVLRAPLVGKVLPIPRFAPILPSQPDRLTSQPDENPSLEQLGILALRTSQGLTGKEIGVAHLDTGIEGNHPAFTGAIAAFADLDHYVCPDPANVDAFDLCGHGTLTAGVIAARPVNGISVGVAPKASLYSAIVGGCTESPQSCLRLIAAINWAVCHDVRVINMSVRVDTDIKALEEVVEALPPGILAVAAIGNEGPGRACFPAKSRFVLSVGACDEDGDELSSSGSGTTSQNTKVPLVLAPGESIRSTSTDGDYAAITGTSIAAAHISGLAAMLFEAFPQASACHVQAAIVDSSISFQGPRRANAVKAYEYLAGMAAPSEDEG